MITENDVSKALNVLKKINIAMLEAKELTAELDGAVKTNDDVTMRIMLSMRQEQINTINEYEKILKKQCETFDKVDSRDFMDVVNGVNCRISIAKDLFVQAQKNKTLLLKLQEADKALNKRVGGKKSVFANS